MKLLQSIGYKKIMNIKEDDIVYEKDGFELAIKDIKNGEKLIEIETEDNEELNTIDKLISKIDKIDIPIYKDSYFVKKAEDIQEAFKPFYDVSVLERETDPNVIYDKLNILRSYKLWYDDNVEKFCKIYLKDGKQNENDFGKLTSCVKETVDLYNKLDIEQRESFRREVKSFNRFYSYITQIAYMGDEELHKIYMYLRYVEKLLPKNKIDVIDLEGTVKLTYYNLKQTFDGSVSLRKTE